MKSKKVKKMVCL